jgi:hypothetical protein
MNCELERMLKKAAVAYLNALPQYSLEDSEQKNKKSQSG